MRTVRAFHTPSQQMYNVTTISFVKEQLFGKNDANAIVDALKNFIVMEWSGVNDAYNNPIFENDLVWNMTLQTWGIIVFEPSMFVVKYPGNINILLTGPRVFEINKKDLQVRGNVLQHAYLLKGGETMDTNTTTPAQPAPAPVESQPAAPAQPEVSAQSGSDVSHLEAAREHLYQALVLLRAERDGKQNGIGARELSHAITLIEDGCMNMNRSPWAAEPYDPRLKLMKAQ